MAGKVMDQGEAGKYRTIRVRVGGYVPPPPERVQPMMSALLNGGTRRRRSFRQS